MAGRITPLFFYEYKTKEEGRDAKDGIESCFLFKGHLAESGPEYEAHGMLVLSWQRYFGLKLWSVVCAVSWL